MKICEKEVGDIGFGTWGIGGGYWQKDFTKDSESIEILSYAYSKGIKLFDIENGKPCPEGRGKIF